MIRETIVTTLNQDGGTHIAPMGIIIKDNRHCLAPFKPSTTLDNLRRERSAVINYTTDVRIFAGCLTGRRTWPLDKAVKAQCRRLADSLSHEEVVITETVDDELRPQCFYEVIHRETHAPFRGFNRAQAAVIELAILVSRLHILDQEKIDREIEYLTIAIDKTAGANERIAWQWLMDKVTDHKQRNRP